MHIKNQTPKNNRPRQKQPIDRIEKQKSSNRCAVSPEIKKIFATLFKGVNKDNKTDSDCSLLLTMESYYTRNDARELLEETLKYKELLEINESLIEPSNNVSINEREVVDLTNKDSDKPTIDLSCDEKLILTPFDFNNEPIYQEPISYLFSDENDPFDNLPFLWGQQAFENIKTDPNFM